MKHDVEVAVYHFRDPDDCREFRGAEPAPLAVLSLHLDLVSTVEIPAAGLTPKEVAAYAWIEAVGRHRHKFLLELDAPKFILEAQTSLREVVAELSEPPAGMDFGLWTFIYGCAGHCESWLMRIDNDWRPDTSGPDATSVLTRPAD